MNKFDPISNPKDAAVLGAIVGVVGIPIALATPEFRQMPLEDIIQAAGIGTAGTIVALYSGSLFMRGVSICSYYAARYISKHINKKNGYDK